MRRALTGAANAPKGTRLMSGGGSIEEEIAEMNKWKVVSAVCVPACVALGYYILANASHHSAERIPYEHLKMRTKRFPWPNGDVALFDPVE
jgi:cytochrome c oxidase subunit 6a